MISAVYETVSAVLSPRSQAPVLNAENLAMLAQCVDNDEGFHPALHPKVEKNDLPLRYKRGMKVDEAYLRRAAKALFLMSESYCFEPGDIRAMMKDFEAVVRKERALVRVALEEDGAVNIFGDW